MERFNICNCTERNMRVACMKILLDVMSCVISFAMRVYVYFMNLLQFFLIVRQKFCIRFDTNKLFKIFRINGILFLISVIAK